MKKIIAVLLLLVLSVAMLLGASGCAKQEYGLNKNKPVTISIWHYYNGAQKQMFDEMVTEFNETVGAEKGIIVEAFNQGNVNELIDKVLDAANHKVGADEIPDIFAAYADTAYQIDKKGLVADLGQYPPSFSCSTRRIGRNSNRLPAPLRSLLRPGKESCSSANHIIAGRMVLPLKSQTTENPSLAGTPLLIIS